MGWKSSSTNPWRSGSTSYIGSVEFAIVSVPPALQRGGSYSLVCMNVSEAPSASTLDGQPVTIDAWNESGIDFTVPMDTLAGHGADKVLSITVAGVTQTVTLPHNPDSGRSVTTLTSFDPGQTDVFEGMVDLDTGNPMTPAAGGQIIYTTPTSPNQSSKTYPVFFAADGSVEFLNVGDDVLDGTETFQFQYLIPGVAISNVVTITASDLVTENVPPKWTSTPNIAAVVGESITFDVSAYAFDANGDSLTFAKVSGNAGIAVSSNGIVSGTIGEPGTYPLLVSVTDGNSSPVTGTFNVVITEAIPENNPPVWNATPLLKGTIGEAFSMDVSQYASDADGDPLTFAKTGGNSAVSVSANGMVSGTINVGGTFPIRISVSDGKAPPVQGIFNLFIAREEVPIMAEMQVAYDSTTKLVTLQPTGADAPAGSAVIGGFDHTAEGDPLGYVGNHVLYHHVQDLLYKEGEYNMQAVTITHDLTPASQEGGGSEE